MQIREAINIKTTYENNPFSIVTKSDHLTFIFIAVLIQI